MILFYIESWIYANSKSNSGGKPELRIPSHIKDLAENQNKRSRMSPEDIRKMILG